MLRRHATLLMALLLLMLVATACFVRTRPVQRRGGPPYAEKHKKQKHVKHQKQKHKKHKD